jgi:hypothetical protein
VAAALSSQTTLVVEYLCSLFSRFNRRRNDKNKESFVLQAAKQLARQSPDGYVSHEELYHRLVDSGQFDPLSAANSIFRLVEARKLIKLKDYFATYILSDSAEEERVEGG